MFVPTEQHYLIFLLPLALLLSYYLHKQNFLRCYHKFFCFQVYCLQWQDNFYNKIQPILQYHFGSCNKLNQNLGLQNVIIQALYPIFLIVSYKVRLYLHLRHYSFRCWDFVGRLLNTVLTTQSLNLPSYFNRIHLAWYMVSMK